MADRTRATAQVFPQRSEFDAFLFTEIGHDDTMPLTVLSALARGDVDPWVEAEGLARLPALAAAERLTSLIAASGGDAGETRDLRTLATRLIGLLPRRGGGNLVSRPAAAAAAIASSRTDIHAIALSAALLAFLLGAGWIIAGRQPAEKAGVAAAAPIARPAPSPDPRPTTASPR